MGRSPGYRAGPNTPRSIDLTPAMTPVCQRPIPFSGIFRNLPRPPHHIPRIEKPMGRSAPAAFVRHSKSPHGDSLSWSLDNRPVVAAPDDARVPRPSQRGGGKRLPAEPMAEMYGLCLDLQEFSQNGEFVMAVGDRRRSCGGHQGVGGGRRVPGPYRPVPKAPAGASRGRGAAVTIGRSAGACHRGRACRGRGRCRRPWIDGSSARSAKPRHREHSHGREGSRSRWLER
jgi:hypothetical protein